MRSLMMEEAMDGMPAPGSGTVMHLVKAFESVLSMPEEVESDKVDDSTKKVMNWALPGLQPPPKSVGTRGNSSLVAYSMEFCFPPMGSQRDSVVYSSLDSNNGRLSLGSMASDGGRMSRRNVRQQIRLQVQMQSPIVRLFASQSANSLRRSWNKKLRVTSQHRFKLRTEVAERTTLAEQIKMEREATKVRRRRDKETEKGVGA